MRALPFLNPALRLVPVFDSVKIDGHEIVGVTAYTNNPEDIFLTLVTSEDGELDCPYHAEKHVVSLDRDGAQKLIELLQEALSEFPPKE